MKVSRIDLHNFRQFYGKQSIELSTDPERNITLVRAENGVGKTTLLNSLMWCLFESHTARFEMPESILSYAAQHEKKARTEVTVTFEHDGKEYQAHRTLDPNAPSKRNVTFKILVNEAGASRPVPNPDLFLRQVLPRPMAPYFFFDGEHAENFSAAAGRTQVRKAISDIFGCNLIDAAQQDLEALYKSVGSELSKSGAGPRSQIEDQLEKLVGEIERFRAEERVLRERLENAKEDEQQQADRVRAYDKQLLEIKFLEEMETRRSELKKGIGTLKAELDTVRARERMWIAHHGPALLRARMDRTLTAVCKPRPKKAPRFEVTQSLINALTHGEECICGRDLRRGSDEFQRLLSLLPQAIDLAFEASSAQLKMTLTERETRRAGASDALLEIRKTKDRFSAQLAEKEKAYMEVEARLANVDSLSIRVLQIERKQEEETLQRLNQKIGADRQRLAYVEQSRKKRELERDSLSSIKKQATGPQALRDLYERARKLLETQKDNYIDDARQQLSEKVNEIMERTTRRAYKFEVTPDLSFAVRFAKSGLEVPRSTGENQLTTLLFTAALLDFAKRRIRDKDALFVPGTVAPLILDSPFGNLDVAYRGAVASEVPGMAEQVVLFLSSSQTTPEVLSSLGDRIGKHYLCRLHTTDAKGRRANENLLWNGQKYPSVVYGSDVSKTEIVELPL
jgi:DNA sulfur modification protein DndD